MEKPVDLLGVGLGPACLTAAIYAARYGMKVQLVGAQPGGQIAVSGELENYPGFSLITGAELSEKMVEHTRGLGVDIVYDTVAKAEKTADGFTLSTDLADTYTGNILLIGTGTRRRKLGAEGEDRLYAKGVTYCATCDGAFFRGQVVGVIGAGNSAAEAALFLADMCPQVHVFVRKPHFRADDILVKKIMAHASITVHFETEIAAFLGEEKLEKVRTKAGEEIEMTGAFIEIGADPEAKLATDLGCELTSGGFVQVDSELRTSVPNVLAAGDVTGAFAQVATSVGAGALAAKTAHELFQQQS